MCPPRVCCDERLGPQGGAVGRWRALWEVGLEVIAGSGCELFLPPLLGSSGKRAVTEPEVGHS